MTSQTMRSELFRMVPTGPAHMRMTDDDQPTLTGYAAVFNQETHIRSWEGDFIETIRPGAFAKTLQERADKIKVLFNHGFDPSIGEKPLGKPATMREDGRGLYVEVPLDDTSYNKDLAALLRSGSLDGMSFKFAVAKDSWERRDGVDHRTVHEVILYEFGPVTFPAYEATTAGVRARDAFLAWRQARQEPQIQAGAPDLTYDVQNGAAVEALRAEPQLRTRNRNAEQALIRLAGAFPEATRSNTS